MAFVKAVRKRAKARIGLCGPAGSGKTMSALKLAFGIVGPAGKIAVLDTENESASLYAHLGEYYVDVIKPPFTVDKYINGIREAERLGYDLIIIDSLSHAWAGTGGILEFVDARSESAKGNKFSGWREATPKHNSLVDAMLQSSMHVIATMRSKTEYILVEDDKGKKVPKKVGMAPVQREGLDFEFTLVFDVDQVKHMATTSKDRTSIFDEFFGTLKEEHGKAIRVWLDTEETSAPDTRLPVPVPPAEEKMSPPMIDADLVAKLGQLIADYGVDETKYLQHLGVESLAQIPVDRIATAIMALEALKPQQPAGTSDGKRPAEIVTVLAARRIPFKMDEENGEVHATPPYQDTASKEFLKSRGFRWNATCKAWVFKKAA